MTTIQVVSFLVLLFWVFGGVYIFTHWGDYFNHPNVLKASGSQILFYDIKFGTTLLLWIGGVIGIVYPVSSP